MEIMQRKPACAIVMAVTLGFLAFAPALLAAGTPPVKVNLEAGEYEFVITYEIQGEPSTRSKIAERCITPLALNSPEEVFSDNVLNQGKASEPCKVRNLKESGENISYDAECSNRIVRVQGTLRGTEFSVVRDVRPKTTHGVSLKFKLQGRRTGDCSLERKKKP
jgi:hypothetical protein